MKKSFLKLTFTVTILALLFLFIKASKLKNKFDIILDENGHIELNISDIGYRNITFSTIDKNIGSIGLRISEQIHWLSGKPSRKKSEEGYIYVWKNDTSSIKLKIEEAGSDYNIELYYTDNAGNKVKEWFLNIASAPEEYYTGIFERVVDGPQSESWEDNIQTSMNLRGEMIEMKLKPTVSAYAPFYISSNNYGLFVKGTWPGTYDFCKSHSTHVKISFEGPSLAFKVYTGKPEELVQKHTMETGPVFVPPRWAFGPWRWRDNHLNKSEYFDGTEKKAPFCTDVVEDVLMMKAYDIPFTAIWIDRPWGPGIRGFDDYEFDRERIPDPEGMIKWLNGHNIELMMWIAPFVMGEMANFAEQHNYDLKSKRWKESRQVLMDFTNDEAVKWWGTNGPGKLARMGIKGFKLDRADGEKLTDSLHLYTSAGTSYRENYNDYPRQYVEAAYKAVKPILGDDFVLFPRAQFTGSARYGAMWAGDTDGKQEGLRSAIIAMQRCAVMGYPVWGSDVGGYWGKFDREVTMRWLGFGCFSPIMEVGPTNDRGFWNNPTEPVYDKELIATWRLYSKIRMELIDYVMGYAVESRISGMPVIRPLFLSYPEQKEAWNDWQTYLFGDDLLVSIVWQKGITKHKLYLPKGETWINAWDLSKEYEGGNYIEVDAPPYKTPVFIRKGSGIDLGDLNVLWKQSLKIASNIPDLKKLEKEEGWE